MATLSGAVPSIDLVRLNRPSRPLRIAFLSESGIGMTKLTVGNGANGVANDGSGLVGIGGPEFGSGEVASPRDGKLSAPSCQSVNRARNAGRSSALSHSGLLPVPVG